MVWSTGRLSLKARIFPILPEQGPVANGKGMVMRYNVTLRDDPPLAGLARWQTRMSGDGAGGQTSEYGLYVRFTQRVIEAVGCWVRRYIAGTVSLTVNGTGLGSMIDMAAQRNSS
jgi:hypothetical protein